jgi:gamma-glutamyltranspeptidase/glutathione hydrolase
MGPPSSGGIGVGQILGILDYLNQTDKDVGPLDSKNIHIYTQAMRLAFADRNQYVADSDFVEVPTEGMIDKQYLINRSALITKTDMGFGLPGVPPGASTLQSSFLTDQEHGTAHISVVDQYGNALSMTTTIESSFGNSVMVNGFLLNNELTDFSFEPIDKETNQTIANRVEGGKRPRSSMSPTIVFDEDGNVDIVTGSAGGSMIIGDTAQSIWNMIEFDLDPQEAANVPHYQNRNEKTEIESPDSGLFGIGLVPYDTEQVSAELQAMGHADVAVVPMWISKLTTIQVVRDGQGDVRLVGGVDQRSNGSIGGNKRSDNKKTISEAQSSNQDSVDASMGLQVTPFLFMGANVVVASAILFHLAMI